MFGRFSSGGAGKRRTNLPEGPLLATKCAKMGFCRRVKGCNQLQDTLDTASKRDAVFVIGDFNAKIGAGHCHEEEKAVIGKFGLGERNKRGDNLVDFCISNDLVVGNTLFQQHPRRLYTWQSPDGKTRNQIDFILVKRRWKSSVRISKTLPGADIGSDHQLLFANIRVKLKRVETVCRAKRFDLGYIGDQYRVETRNGGDPR